MKICIENVDCWGHSFRREETWKCVIRFPQANSWLSNQQEEVRAFSYCPFPIRICHTWTKQHVFCITLQVDASGNSLLSIVPLLRREHHWKYRQWSCRSRPAAISSHGWDGWIGWAAVMRLLGIAVEVYNMPKEVLMWGWSPWWLGL